MPILSEAEIEDLQQTHPKKKIIRIGFLVSGILISIIGLLLFLLEVDLGLIVDSINLSLLIDILIIIVGLIIASKYFIAPYFLRENSITLKHARHLREPPFKQIKFFSFALSRLVAAIILLVIGVISFLIFGTDVGHEIEYGSAVVLGGPSFFYLTGLPMLVVGISLLLYFGLSIFRGIFSESENFYFFYEFRTGFPWLTEVPKKNIEAVRFQNNHLGPKLAWIVFFVPFIVLQLMTAIPLFFVEKAGPEYVLSWFFLIFSVLEVIVMIILVYFQQNYFEIASNDMLYEMWFSPIKLKNRGKLKESFKDLFDASSSTLDKKDPKEEPRVNSLNNDLSFKNINKSHYLLFRLLFGVFLLITSIIMMTQMILFGPFVWWIAFTYGIILIIKAFNYDISSLDGNTYKYNSQQKLFTMQRQFKFKFSFMQFRNVKSLEITKWYRKMDFFDFAAVIGLLVFLPLQQFQGWIFADTLTLVLDNLFSTFVMLIILITVFLYICLPIDVIELKTTSIDYRIEIKIIKGNKSFLKRLIADFFEGIKAIFRRDMKKVFLIRFGMMISIIIGVCVYMAIYFAFFF